MNRAPTSPALIRRLRRLLAAALVLAGPAARAAEEVWTEGESARASDVRRHSWYSSVKKGLLSGGEWLSHFGDRDGTADYEVEARSAGKYTFWLRANPIQAALSYRLNGGDWVKVDFAKPIDSINIAADSKPDLRFVAWIKAGAVPLRKGTNSLSFKMHSANQHHGAIDCFLFTTGPFRPRGSQRPGHKLGLYWFSLGSPGYDATVGKWQAATPAIIGGFPAAALIFRKGYIRDGKPAVHEERSLEDIWSLEPGLISEAEPFDPNRSAGIGAAQPAGRERVHPLAFLVGPVEVSYGGDPARSRVEDIGRHIDEGKRTVTSNTGELKLDYGRGVATMYAPKAQGASGFLSRAGDIRLGAVEISSRNEYATVLVVPLDDGRSRTAGRSSSR